MASAAPPPPPPPPPIAPPPPPMGAPPYMATPPPGAPTQKKTSPLLWVLVGCGGLLLLTAIVLVVAGVFVAHKVGKYAKDAEKNPAMAAAKLIVAMNPDLETVDTDDARGTITIRNKKTGEQITVDMDEVKKGHIRFQNEKGEKVDIQAKGEEGSEGVEIKSDHGTMKFGQNAEAGGADWVPTYPGSAPKGVYSATTDKGATGAWQFETNDSIQEVLGFYEKELKDAGFDVNTSTMKKGGRLAGGIVTATDEAQGRTVTVSASEEQGQTQVAVHYASGRS